jgi:dCMP deaminase
VAIETSKLSYANRLKVGAIVVKDKRIILCGYNGTPEGFSNQCEDENNKTVNEVLHAEENLILYAAKSGISLKGSELFITHSPCINCSKLIYGSGIYQINFLDHYRSNEGILFLEKIGIKCNQYQF